MAKYRIPRKLKKQIPLGLYCYKGLRFDWNTGDYYIKNCVFYTHIKNKDKPIEQQDELDKEYLEECVGCCKLVKCEIDDQCKCCGWRKGY